LLLLLRLTLAATLATTIDVTLALPADWPALRRLLCIRLGSAVIGGAVHHVCCVSTCCHQTDCVYIALPVVACLPDPGRIRQLVLQPLVSASVHSILVHLILIHCPLFSLATLASIVAATLDARVACTLMQWIFRGRKCWCTPIFHTHFPNMGAGCVVGKEEGGGDQAHHSR
jgi:hypothetical protein